MRDGSLGVADRPRHLDPMRRWRSTYAWQVARHAQITRVPFCQDPECREPVTASNPLTADHIVPVSKGGAVFERSNLQTLCRIANSRKKDRDA